MTLSMIGMPDAGTTFPDIAQPADRSRLAGYAEALAFYQGDQWLGRQRRGQTRLTFNYARTLLRKVASYVFPAAVTFSVPNTAGNPEQAARAEQRLAETVAALDLTRLDIALCIDQAVLGDAALKVTWDAVKREPVVGAVDPATLFARSAPDNPTRVERMSQLYQLTGEAIGRLFGGAEALDPTRAYPVREDWTTDRWRVEIAGQTVRDEVNPYGWLPYVIAPNNPRPFTLWGESDLADLYDVCRELNARMSVLTTVLELSGAPIAVLENVDGSEGIAVGPGAKWELPEGAKAYLLDLLAGGGVNLHIDYVNLLYRALHDLSETPRTAFGDSGRELSGAALEVEIQPLVQKVHRKRQAWDAVYRQRNTRLLDLLERFGGHDLGGLRRTETIWPSVLPSDADSAVRNQVQLVTSGIHSRRTAAAALGSDDPETEFQRVLDELAAMADIASAPAVLPAGTMSGRVTR